MSITGLIVLSNVPIASDPAPSKGGANTEENLAIASRLSDQVLQILRARSSGLNFVSGRAFRRAFSGSACTRTGTPETIATARERPGHLAMLDRLLATRIRVEGRLDEARPLLTESVELLEECDVINSGNDGVMGQYSLALSTLGELAIMQDRFKEGRLYLKKTISIARHLSA